eukprot:c52509_g1_i1.p1 GENE.c52509_g1_i1~~c52509_g1_i1.p1  ORF type:complete len:512 (+),score=109.74 c52509_g1_i1:46-1581(+)
MLGVVVVAVICVLITIAILFGKRQVSLLAHIPGPPPNLFTGNIPELVKFCASNPPAFDTSPFFHHLSLQYGPVFRLFLAPFCLRRTIVVVTPEAAQEIIIRKNPMKSNGGYQNLRRVLGFGLVTALPEAHKPRRRMLEPAFGAKYLKITIFGSMVRLIDDILGVFQSKLKDSDEWVMNVGSEMQKLTMDVICVSGFDVDPLMRLGKENEYSKLVTSWSRVLRELSEDLTNPFRRITAPLATLQFYRDVKIIRSMMGEIIQHRIDRLKKGDPPGTDLLSVMLQADPPMSIQDITDEVTTFNLAGQDTTAHWLTWTLYHLALDRDLQQKCRREAKKILQGQSVLSTDPSPTDVPYIEALLRECLRVYPPAGATVREFEEDVTLNGMVIPARTEILVATAVFQITKAYWGEDVDKFRPDRFIGKDGQLLSLEESTTNPLAFAPFSLGARSCIGRYFANMEARAFVIMFLNQFDVLGLSPEMKEHPGVFQAITLKPARPVLVRVRRHDPTDPTFC